MLGYSGYKRFLPLELIGRWGRKTQTTVPGSIQLGTDRGQSGLESEKDFFLHTAVGAKLRRPRRN